MHPLLAPLSRILVPTDLSPRAEAAVDFAVRLAEADGGTGGTEVVLLHVFAFPYDWYHWPSAALTGLRKHVECEAEARLTALAQRKASPAVRVRPRLVVRTDVPAAVLAAAAEEGADLVVMGTRGWTGERPALGSVTAQVVRRARRPVLAVPRTAVTAEGLPPGRVVVPADCSNAAAEALRVGHALATRRRAPLLVFHVLSEDVLEAETWGGEPVEAADEPLLAQYEHRVRRFVEDALGGDADVRLSFAVGTADGILDAATPPDLLVLAPHHGGALTEEILTQASCPVLVLPATAATPALASADAPPRAAASPARRTEAPAFAAPAR
jgi:nucleotide-binding universal stress UspA family protein